jgi:hypothetical protein
MWSQKPKRSSAECAFQASTHSVWKATGKEDGSDHASEGAKVRFHHAIQLQPKGRLVRMEWNQETGRHVEQAVSVDEFTYYLHSTICFAEGTTLRDLLMLVVMDQELFMMLTACDCLRELLEELDITATPIEEAVALELAWTAEAVPIGITTVIDSSVEFYGLGGDNGHVGLEFMPSGRISGLPILLNEAFNICDGENPDKVVFSTTRRFTLLEVVSGVIEELTFLGSPKERDEALDDLRGRMESADDGEFYTIEEVRAEWEQRSEEDRKRFPCRMCSEDSRCACFGKPHDICHDCFNGMKEN